MKVAAYYGTGDVRVEERPVPVPGPNQMVVKISYVGICGTDVEFFHGHCPPFVQLPMVLGHENSGVVAAVGEGVIFYACSGNCGKAQQEAFLRYMAPAGKLFPLAEELHAAGSAVAGCGPAFAAIFLESMADGGVACGLPRASAIQYAAQMMLGTAKMVLETNQHPGVLKDSVCSPAGSTIQGVRTLEERGMRAAVLDAVTVAYEKNVELKKASD